jgi:hypothetical protein
MLADDATPTELPSGSVLVQRTVETFCKKMNELGLFADDERQRPSDALGSRRLT